MIKKIIILLLMIMSFIFFGFLPSGTGKSGVLIIASANSPDNLKRVANYVCDGVDDQVQINEALSVATTGNSVYLAGGDFEISNSVNIPYSYSKLTMDKDSTLLVNQAQTTLSVQPAVDATTITVADGTGFIAGMYIRISDDSHCNVRSVASITGNVITLGNGYFSSETGNLAVTYAVGSDVVVVYDAVMVGSSAADTTDIILDGVNIDGQWDEIEPADGAENGSTDDGTEKTDYYLNGIRVPRTHNLLIQNCRIVDVTYNSILLHGGSLSKNTRILNNDILTGSTYSQSRGIAHESTDNFFLIRGNKIETTATTSSLTMNNGIYANCSETYNYGVVADNYVKGWYLGINFFGGNENISVKDNKIIACTRYGIQLISTDYCSITDNTVDMRGDGLNGVYLSSSSPVCNSCVISGNKILNVKGGYKGIQIYGTYHTIKDNYIHTASTMGAGIDVLSTFNNISGNVISGNANVKVGKEITGSVICEPTCDNILASAGGAVTTTLADCSEDGKIIRISMRNATNASTLTIAHHASGNDYVYNFNETTDYVVLQWNGVTWDTLGATATIPE